MIDCAAASSSIQKRFKIHGICHRAIAVVTGMEVVASVIAREQMTGIFGIFEQTVEVDGRVEGPAGAYPFIDVPRRNH